jgi:hypothetical protein
LSNSIIKSSQIAWKPVPLRHFFPLKVVPLIEVLLYLDPPEQVGGWTRVRLSGRTIIESAMSGLWGSMEGDLSPTIIHSTRRRPCFFHKDKVKHTTTHIETIPHTKNMVVGSSGCWWSLKCGGVIMWEGEDCGRAKT